LAWGAVGKLPRLRMSAHPISPVGQLKQAHKNKKPCDQKAVRKPADSHALGDQIIVGGAARP